MRVIRPLRLVNFNKSLKITLNALVKSFKQIINITSFILVFFIVFAIFGMA